MEFEVILVVVVVEALNLGANGASNQMRKGIDFAMENFQGIVDSGSTDDMVGDKVEHTYFEKFSISFCMLVLATLLAQFVPNQVAGMCLDMG